MRSSQVRALLELFVLPAPLKPRMPRRSGSQSIDLFVSSKLVVRFVSLILW